jgi:dTDP-4-dehydrorhamnose 3,5-epimerase
VSDNWHLEGMERRGQSVTSEWEIVDQPPIEGVVVHPIATVPTSYGRLAEVWRSDWKLDERGIDQVFTSVLEPGQITGWHAHAATTDRLFVVSGHLHIVLYDGRRPSSTYGHLNHWRVGSTRRALLCVPPGVWHGVRNETGDPAILLNAVDVAYSYTDPDHWSVPPDCEQIPYDLTG